MATMSYGDYQNRNKEIEEEKEKRTPPTAEDARKKALKRRLKSNRKSGDYS